MHSLQAFFRQCFLFSMLTTSCATPWAGEFVVNPIRLELGAAARSGVIGVRNEGREKLSFQMQAMAWTQDAQGLDQYADTKDLIFFPKVMTVEPGEEGVIRIGTKFPVVPQEKTYRLFIEELPSTVRPAPDKGVQINVLIRFGAPIFIKPPTPEDRMVVDAVILTRGELSLIARNAGNQHQVVEGIQLNGVDRQGREVYALTLADRYLLAGTSKRYSTLIPKDQCTQIAQLQIEFKTDKSSLNSKLEVTKAMCL